MGWRKLFQFGVCALPFVVAGCATSDEDITDLNENHPARADASPAPHMEVSSTLEVKEPVENGDPSSENGMREHEDSSHSNH